MSAAWAAVMVAIAIWAGGTAGWIWRAGRREGKIDVILQQLTQMAADHENRIRDLQRRR